MYCAGGEESAGQLQHACEGGRCLVSAGTACCCDMSGHRVAASGRGPTTRLDIAGLRRTGGRWRVPSTQRARRIQWPVACSDAVASTWVSRHTEQQGFIIKLLLLLLMMMMALDTNEDFRADNHFAYRKAISSLARSYRGNSMPDGRRVVV